MNSALFIGDWDSVAMMHLEIAPKELQPTVPFELDLFDGSAFVSLVFFTMRNMRLARAPAPLNWLFHPFREQRFLNVRTYVRHKGERGIHFIKEWISNPLCAHLGPLLYSLPYRRGAHRFDTADNTVRARVTDRASKTTLACHFTFTELFHPCEPNTRDEFFFERYAAFNSHTRNARSFRVSHAPWRQCRADATLLDASLLWRFRWFRHSHAAGANYSPGVPDVRMGWPRAITRPVVSAHLHPLGQTP